MLDLSAWIRSICLTSCRSRAAPTSATSAAMRTADGRKVRRGAVFRSAHLGDAHRRRPDGARPAGRAHDRRPARRRGGRRDAAPRRWRGLPHRRRPYRARRRREDPRRRGRRQRQPPSHDAVPDRPLSRLSAPLRAGLPHALRHPDRRHAPPAGVPLHRRQGPYGLCLGAAAQPAGRAVGDGDGGLPAHQRPVDRPYRPLSRARHRHARRDRRGAHALSRGGLRGGARRLRQPRGLRRQGARPRRGPASNGCGRTCWRNRWRVTTRPSRSRSTFPNAR